MAKLALQTYFQNLKDPRRAPRHLLGDIIGIAVCAVVSGADEWQQIVTFAQQREPWLRRFFALPEGIPCHDTFERVFDRLDPRAFTLAFGRWMQALADAVGWRQVAIDGKTLRRSGAPTRGLGPLHLVSAWATANDLALGQVAVDGKSNEITAIPELLDLLELRGAIVTLDAMGCQKAIAAKIRDRGGHYLLTVKENQEHLLADIQQAFATAAEQDFAGVPHDTYETRDSGHGRQEYRCYTVLQDVSGLRGRDEWRDLTVIGMGYSQRTLGDKTSEAVRWFTDEGGDKVYQYLDDARKQRNPLWPRVSPRGRHLQNILAGLAHAIDGDHTTDLARLLRLPNTLNRKDERNGVSPMACELVHCDPARRYPLAEFERFAVRAPAFAVEQAVAQVRLKTGAKLTVGRRNRLADFLNACAIAADRSVADFSLCCWALEQGLDREAVWAECQTVGKFAARGREYFELTWSKAQQRVRFKVYQRVSGSNRLAATPAARDDLPPASPPSGRKSPDDGLPLPTIVGNRRQLRDVTDDALAALLAHNDPQRIFQRGGVLSRLRMKEQTPGLEALAEAALRGVLARVADWKIQKDSKYGPVAEDDAPPLEVVKDLANLPAWDGVPPLDAIIECPAFGRHGGLVQTPGYDAQARLYYQPTPGLNVPPVPTAPTLAEVAAARDLLLVDLFGDFPFADAASRAHALAALLLPFARMLIAGPTPLHLFDAPTEGTGKTLLATVITLTVTGREAEGLPEAGDADEWRKRITATLAEAPVIIFVDNINKVLDASGLASVLTATTWKDRLLGFSMTATLPNHAVWLASGNNTRLSRDSPCRTLFEIVAPDLARMSRATFTAS